MLKSLITSFLACYFLLGSTILPLGDFSLMADLPSMYRSYSEITAEKPDIIDFIGDYVMGGKELFGHNKHDAPLKPDGSTQFQHQATSFLYFTFISYQVHSKPQELLSKPIITAFMFFPSDYQCKTFRPPIA